MVDEVVSGAETVAVDGIQHPQLVAGAETVAVDGIQHPQLVAVSRA